jgi:penicillin-binding protein 1A
MLAAHQNLAIRDFPWLLPDPGPRTSPDPRNGFYETLASEFARTASELESEAAQDEPADDGRGPVPAPEELPY